MNTAYLQFSASPNGPFQTVSVPCMETRLPYPRSQTGYGPRMASAYKVKWAGRWRRVYICNYGNSGTAYIGRSLADCVAKVDF